MPESIGNSFGPLWTGLHRGIPSLPVRIPVPRMMPAWRSVSGVFLQRQRIELRDAVRRVIAQRPLHRRLGVGATANIQLPDVVRRFVAGRFDCLEERGSVRRPVTYL